MFCPNCGSQMQEGATFCTQCGTSIQDIRRLSRPAYRTGTTGFSFAIIVVALLELLGAILSVFTPILYGPRRWDKLSPLLGWTRGDTDYAWVHGQGELTNSESTIIVIAIIFLFLAVVCIAMALIKKWVKGSIFLMLGSYALYLVVLKATATSLSGTCTYAPMAFITLIILAGTAFISLGFTSGSKEQKFPGTKQVRFSGKRAGVLSCILAAFPCFLAWMYPISYVAEHVKGGMMTAIVTFVPIVCYVAMMLTCMILVGKRNSRTAMTLAFVIGGIGSVIASTIYWLSNTKDHIWGWAAVGLIGTAIMAIGMFGVYGSQKLKEQLQN